MGVKDDFQFPTAKITPKRSVLKQYIINFHGSVDWLGLAGLFLCNGSKLAAESSEGLSGLGIHDGFFTDLSDVSVLLHTAFISNRAV